MLRVFLFRFPWLVLLIVFSARLALAQSATPLFDGATLRGWEGNTAVWRVEEGALVGGSLEGNPRNEFLATTRSYRNFVLKLEYKLVGTEGFVNGGVQIRSRRIAQPAHEMSGYQADIGAGYSGFLYDESRRKRVLAAADKKRVEEVEKPGEWNRYEIRCEGPRVQLFINGKQTVDYTEREPGIEQEGLIALQIHGACKAVISFRNVTLVELPDDLVPTEAEILKRLSSNVDSALSITASGTEKSSAVEGLPPQSLVVTLGQGNLDRGSRTGILEAMLSQAFRASRPRFRPMAWEGDTVFKQWRDAQFGTLTQQLEAVGATHALVQFGGVEALDDTVSLDDFVSAFENYLRDIPSTVSVVLLSPTPVEGRVVGTDQAERSNARLARYTQAIAALAERNGRGFVDVFHPLLEWERRGERFTENGLHLSAVGQLEVGRQLTRHLGGSVPKDRVWPELLAAISEKNRIWFECWRPANWPFAFGDRATQPYGRAFGEQPSLRELFALQGERVTQEERRIEAIMKAGPQPSPLTPAEELATFTVADGFAVTLFADESMGVVKPTQIAWDERGRLWVACAPTYPQPLPGVRPGDYILILEDTDGDGKADRSQTFARGLSMVLGLEPGAGGVYVCDYDQLVHLRDTDGDGMADERRVLLSGFGVGDTHQMINSLSHGPDGSLWFSQGFHAFSRIETPYGLSILEKAGLWRYRPRTQTLDSFFNGGKAGYNCWGVTFDDYGQMFHKSGDRPAGYYSTPGLIRLSNPDDYHPTGALFATDIKTTAIELLGSDSLPEDLQGCAVIAGYFGNVVELHRIQDDGSGFKTEQLPKLVKSSSRDFRPVDVAGGPDGGIYLADWYNPVIGHYQASYADPARDKSRGRIWRIASTRHPPQKKPALADLNTWELLEMLRSNERWSRTQAKRVLFERSRDEVVPEAVRWWRHLDPSGADIGRLWVEVAGVFQAHGAVQADLVNALLNSRDFRVRAYGTRVLGDWWSELSQPKNLLEQRLQDEHPRVRLEAVVAAVEAKGSISPAMIVKAVDRSSDRFLDYAVVQALRALETAWRPAFAGDSYRFARIEPYASLFRRAALQDLPAEHPGRLVYENACLNCHQPDGAGLAGVYPPLRDSIAVQGDPDRVIRIVLHGLNGALQVGKENFGGAGIIMPPSALNDRQVADVLTYLRSHFGNQAPAVSLDTVSRVRSAYSARTRPWTVAELNEIEAAKTDSAPR
ncbi:MAG TPA: DUF1080 domain-containing protein [Opitutaceae bacterium]|nr:DUF1080 domain-containing protein [Opitutaceae bacterium]